MIYTQNLFLSENKCGGDLVGSKGLITNPTTFTDQTEFATCVWTIEANPSSQINLKFSQIDLPGDCDNSHIIIRGGKSSDAKIIGKYCGYERFVDVMSDSHRLWIEYRSPAQENIGKFVMTWNQINETGNEMNFKQLFLNNEKSAKYR